VCAEAVFREERAWGTGPYAGADYNHTLSHSRLRSQLSYTKGKGWGGSFLLVGHICVCLLIREQVKNQKEKGENEEEMGADSYVLE
jgi:hypothetical protein